MTSDEAMRFLGNKLESAEMHDDCEDFVKVIDLIEQQQATIARLLEEKLFLEGEISTLNDQIKDLERLNAE